MKKTMVLMGAVLALGLMLIGCPTDTDSPTPLTGMVNITGTPQVGQTLTANTGGLGGSGAVSFQWQRGTTSISGANSEAYTVQTSDVGSTIRVTVTRANNTGSVTSAATATVPPVPGPAPGPDPGPTPGPTPGPDPGPTPGPTPGPDPGPTPGPTPEPDPSPGPTPPPGDDTTNISFSISPTSYEIARGRQHLFTTAVQADVENTVDWSIDETGRHQQTTISAAGVLNVAREEPLNTLTVRATLRAHPSVSRTSNVTVTGAAEFAVDSVVVFSQGDLVERGRVYEFRRMIIAENIPPEADTELFGSVDWSIDETDRHPQTTISDDGRLSVAAAEPLKALTVRATSRFSPSVSGMASVSVIGNIAGAPPAPTPTVTQVRVIPANIRVPRGEEQNLIASVIGTNHPSNEVQWTLVGVGAGASISPAGMGNAGRLTVSSAATVSSTFRVRATSRVNPSVFGEATVTVIPGENEVEAPIPPGPPPGGTPAPGGTLAQRLEFIRTTAENGSIHTIEITGDEAIVAQPQLVPTGRNNVTITLRGVGGMQTITLSGQGSLFTVPAGVTLILDNNVTLRGNNSNNNHLVRVNNGGTLVMNAGAVVSGNWNRSTSNTTLGGGVAVMPGGTFTMNGGRIYGNNATQGSGGGVRVNSGGTFNMNDGEISGNNLSTRTGSLQGGGVYVVNGGTATMRGGSISDNTALYGGGVGVSGRFNMYGGTISSNEATRDGGGVRVSNNGVFNLIGGRVYINAASRDGGGAFVVANGTLNMRGGSFSSNTAARDGGGVFNAGLLRINDGTIYGRDDARFANTAFGDASRPGRGAALFNQERSVFQRGIFNERGDFTSEGPLPSTTAGTVRVVNGNFQR